MSKRLQPTNTWTLIESDSALPTHLAKDLILQGFPGWLTTDQAEAIYEYMGDDFSYTNPHGRLLTRLEKAYLKVVGKDVEGNYRYFFDHMRYATEQLISAYRTPTLYYNLTDNLKWERGEYMDDGSCMFGEYPYARAVLVKYGALALLARHAYQSADGSYAIGGGAGRCWVIPLESGNFYMRNYMGLTQQQMTDIMRRHLFSLGTEVLAVSDRNVDLSCYVEGDKVYCYDNSNTIHLQVEQGVTARYEKRTLDVEPCYCCASAKHNNRMPEYKRKELPVCTLCPWKYENIYGEVHFDFSPDGDDE